MMKHRLLRSLVVAWLALGAGHAQEIDTLTISKPETAPIMADAEMAIVEPQPVRLPALTLNGTYPTLGYYPWTLGLGIGEWNLHKGMNLTFGASVFTSFGKHAYHGAGFGQNAAMMYAQPLSNRLTAAAGVYMNNLTWGHDSYRTVGLSALLNYQLTERLDAFVFGQKRLMENVRIPYPLYDMGELGDRIGLGMHYKFSPAFSFSASFSYGTR